jgi:Protein of unknown function (DUF551)
MTDLTPEEIERAREWLSANPDAVQSFVDKFVAITGSDFDGGDFAAATKRLLALYARAERERSQPKRRMKGNIESYTEAGFPAPHLYEHDYQEGCDDLPACEPIERERQWIGVEERLPELNSAVWIWVAGNGESAYFRGDKWELERTAPQDETIDFCVDSGQVTHWQPLPEPPAIRREEK